MNKKLSQNIAYSFMWLCGIIAIGALLLIIGYVLIRGIPGISWEFFTTKPKAGMSGEGGILPMLISTAWLLGMTMAILIPIGFFSAVYLSEYAPANKLTTFVKYCIETLAGIPSIIFGVFGFMVLILIFGFDISITVGSIVLACLLLPFMICTAEEAIKVVPQNARSASLALGATKWQTVWRVVLPVALAGIFTAIILSIARALSETACLFLTMGSFSAIPTSPADGGRSLAMHIYYLTVELGKYEAALSVAAVLIVIILAFSIITNIISTLSRKKLGMGRY